MQITKQLESVFKEMNLHITDSITHLAVTFDNFIAIMDGMGYLK
jgi:hypothetical protein